MPRSGWSGEEAKRNQRRRRDGANAGAASGSSNAARPTGAPGVVAHVAADTPGLPLWASPGRLSRRQSVDWQSSIARGDFDDHVSDQESTTACAAPHPGPQWERPAPIASQAPQARDPRRGDQLEEFQLKAALKFSAEQHKKHTHGDAQPFTQELTANTTFGAWGASQFDAGDIQPWQPASKRGSMKGAPQPTKEEPASKQRPEVSSRDLLLEAIQSLYDDKLEPLDQHVSRRIEELSGNRWNADHLKAIAREMPEVRIVEKRDSANRCWLYLVNEEDNFVDQNALQDPYPAHLWGEIKRCIEGLAWDSDSVVPSSRYHCAQRLRRCVPALERYNLGQVCHIVQLAVKVHRLLGYRNGCLVPYAKSLDSEKRAKAEQLKPSDVHPDSHVVAAWDEARRNIRELLSDPQWPHGVPLSALKARFRTKFGRELSETALGHTKLSALVEDPHLQEICKLFNNGSERFLCLREAPHTSSSSSSPRKASRRNPGAASSGRTPPSAASQIADEWFASPPRAPRMPTRAANAPTVLAGDDMAPSNHAGVPASASSSKEPFASNASSLLPPATAVGPVASSLNAVSSHGRRQSHQQAKAASNQHGTGQGPTTLKLAELGLGHSVVEKGTINSSNIGAAPPNPDVSTQPLEARKTMPTEAQPNRSMHSPKRSAHSPQRSLKSPQRALQSPQRALQSPKQSTPQRSLKSPQQHSLQSPIRSAASPKRHHMERQKSFGSEDSPDLVEKERAASDTELFAWRSPGELFDETPTPTPTMLGAPPGLWETGSTQPVPQAPQAVQPGQVPQYTNPGNMSMPMMQTYAPSWQSQEMMDMLMYRQPQDMAVYDRQPQEMLVYAPIIQWQPFLVNQVPVFPQTEYEYAEEPTLILEEEEAEEPESSPRLKRSQSDPGLQIRSMDSLLSAPARQQTPCQSPDAVTPIQTPGPTPDSWPGSQQNSGKGSVRSPMMETQSSRSSAGQEVDHGVGEIASDGSGCSSGKGFGYYNTTKGQGYFYPYDRDRKGCQDSRASSFTMSSGNYSPDFQANSSDWSPTSQLQSPAGKQRSFAKGGGNNNASAVNSRTTIDIHASPQVTGGIHAQEAFVPRRRKPPRAG